MVLGGSEVLNRVMLNTLSGMHTSLAMLLNMSDSKGAEIPNHPSQSKRWRKVEPLARMYLVNTTHALEQMSEDAMVSFTLRSGLPRAFTMRLLRVSTPEMKIDVNSFLQSSSKRLSRNLRLRAPAICSETSAACIQDMGVSLCTESKISCFLVFKGYSCEYE